MRLWGGVLGFALCVGPAACEQGLSPAETAFADRASAAAVAAAPDPKTARVVSIAVHGVPTIPGACGWISLGGQDGVVPFDVMADAFHPEDANEDLVTVPRLFRGDYAARLRAAFDETLIKVNCDIGDRLPPAPANATTLPEIDAELLRLWRPSPGIDWAVVPAIGEPGFAAVRRRIGGGAVISPLFKSRAEVRQWIFEKGNGLALEADRRGRARMDAWDACYARHPDRKDPAREHCTD